MDKQMQKFEIENGVEMPNNHWTGRRGRFRNTIREMAVGQSFFVPFNGQSQRGIASTIHQGGKVCGFVLATRRMEKDGVQGLRVWRLE